MWNGVMVDSTHQVNTCKLRFTSSAVISAIILELMVESYSCSESRAGR